MKFTASPQTFFRTYFAIGASISLAAIYQTQLQTQALSKIRTRYKWALLIVLFAVNAAAGLYVVFRPNSTGAVWDKLSAGQLASRVAKAAAVLLVLLPVPIFWYARLDFFGRGLEAFFRLLWLFWWLALLQTAGLRWAAGIPWAVSLPLILLCDGLAAQLYFLGLPITDYPFSAGWSEASRFYYASLVFSRAIYGTQWPLSIWHGTRYLLLSIPFILKGLSLWAARTWQVLLWLVLTGATCWSLARRLAIRDRVSALILSGWFFLFLFQGAVYYHLQVCVIVIFLGVSTDHRLRSVAAIVAASFWAGMSRLNWYPVPAILAIALYVMETPWQGARDWWAYVKTLVVWAGAGLAGAFAGQIAYIAISGNTNLQAFGSSLTSALLWYRWFPSDTNPIGIIPGVLLISLPLAGIVYSIASGAPARLHPLRAVGLSGMLAILLVGGLVVSTKIGGGGDLHNMDAYLVLLGLIGTYFICERIAPDADPALQFRSMPWPLLVPMILVPVAFALLRLGPAFTYDRAKARADLAVLGQQVESYGGSGPVLFMYERQLLTFGMVPRVPLVPDYEVVTLMEMAISGNEPYLSQFYRDLASHRFAAIVAHPQNLGVETGDFIEESNEWNRLIAQPMLCQYKPAITLDYSKVQILVPRARPCPDFPPQVRQP